VVGVDIVPMPNHPHEFIQADALDVLNDGRFVDTFDVIHASPPCQAYTPLRALSPDKSYPDLISAVRLALQQSGKSWVIENVMSAPLLGGIVLCGGMFGLRTYRHRRFESSVLLLQPPHPRHTARTATTRRRERWDQGWHVSVTGDVGTYVGPEAMGIDWMTGNELSQAIPPAYTEFIGEQLLTHVAERAA
jgi:DNA (cytosine-5)-methyltransferase 1